MVDITKKFRIAGSDITLAEMQAANSDDRDFCDWLARAEVGSPVSMASVPERAQADDVKLTSDDVGKVVGYFTIPAGKRYTELFEVAAWSREHEYVPGEYPVLLREVRYSRSGPPAGYRLVCERVPSKIVDQSMPTLFGGMAVPGTDRKEDIGKSGTVDFCAARAMTIEELNLSAIRFTDPGMSQLAGAEEKSQVPPVTPGM